MTNERHMKLDELARDLDILRELDKRDALDEVFKAQLHHLESKEMGLQRVMSIFEEYAKPHWNYMTHVAMDAENRLKCNLLVMTSTNVYPLEINHYEGHFEYRNGASYLNGKKLAENPIQIAKDVTSQITGKIRFCSMPIFLDVKGAAIFTGSSDVCILDDIGDIEIVTEDQLKKFVFQMILEERENGGSPRLILNNISWLSRVDRRQPVIPFKIPRHIKNQITLGVRCSYCYSFDAQVGEIFTGCPCGGFENTEEAIVRTICEYGVLNNGKHLELSDLQRFFNGDVPDELLETYLEKHFTPVY